MHRKRRHVTAGGGLWPRARIAPAQESAFETSDANEIVQRILKRGKFQTSSDERKGKVEEKRKQIVQRARAAWHPRRRRQGS